MSLLGFNFDVLISTFYEYHLSSLEFSFFFKLWSFRSLGGVYDPNIVYTLDKIRSGE